MSAIPGISFPDHEQVEALRAIARSRMVSADKQELWKRLNEVAIENGFARWSDLICSHQCELDDGMRVPHVPTTQEIVSKVLAGKIRTSIFQDAAQ